ncbi:hypothetical protein SBRCBS47491_004163 [Sporothrix bragantina]|uniref:Zn(2)-C6 fungal-type domain-containing protein n=1 Tax=Sporothrix bragantina TaxID=671064 RepID=A0ABP0BLH3_9PEZI
MDSSEHSSSGDEPRDDREGSPDLEPLACVACRARKLKCNRTKPACSRCTKATDGTVCVYPESRRKPMFKRRNVKDLEARLAQVEGLLKDAPILDRKRGAEDQSDEASSQAVRNGTGLFSIITEAEQRGSPGGPGSTLNATVEEDEYSSELVDLGMSESLPPYEIIEVLHEAYFQNQHMFIPIVHQARYLKAFHSAPHLRPPMGLQYAIWAMSSQVYRKYSGFHDAFYRRARQYLENDEMKGHGEHFITIGHAQAWALLAAYEARRLFFTRAAMSCSRAVRLVGMMGLNRLDDESGGDRIAATLQPPEDWTELEERRRVYWGAFCVDSHASISTGWPTLINANDATTHLPSSEDAFTRGIPQSSSSLENIFSGSTYSTFSSAILVCHLFNSILLHVQLKPGDRPEDFDYGPFWQRHRSLDTKLSSAFVFLPERYRLPNNFHDPVAVHTNLNLHAATICLHNAAVERAEAHDMPASVVQGSHDRMFTAAQEIVNIMEKTAYMAASYKSPMASLSLYCATSVFIYQAMMHEKNQTQHTEAAETAASSVEFIIRCMDNGRSNNVTRLLLHQAILDVDRNGLALSKHFAWFKRYSNRAVDAGHYVPVLARSAVSRHSWMQPPMAGRLPLINDHNAKIMRTQQCCTAGATNMCDACRRREASLKNETRFNAVGAHGSSSNNAAKTTKRRRMQSPQTTGASPAGVAQLHYGGAFVVLPHRAATSSSSVLTPSDAVSSDDEYDEEEGDSVGATRHSGSSTVDSSSHPSISTQGSLSGLVMGTLASSIPPGVSLSAGTAGAAASNIPKDMSRQTASSLFPSVSIPDLWNGPVPSLMGNTDLGHGSFMGLPGSNIELPSNGLTGGGSPTMNESFSYNPLNDTVQTTVGFDDAAAIEAVVSGDDAWTSFLQAGDFDSTDWAAVDNQQ